LITEVKLCRLHYRRPAGDPVIVHVAFGKIFYRTSWAATLPLTEIANDLGLDIATFLIFKCPPSGLVTLASVEAFYDSSDLHTSYKAEFMNDLLTEIADRKELL